MFLEDHQKRQLPIQSSTQVSWLRRCVLSCLKLAISITNYNQAGNSHQPPRMSSPPKKRVFAERARSFCTCLWSRGYGRMGKHCPCQGAPVWGEKLSVCLVESPISHSTSEPLNNTFSHHSEVLRSTSTPLMQTNHKMNLLFTLHRLILKFLSASPSHQQRTIEQCHTEHLSQIW